MEGGALSLAEPIALRSAMSVHYRETLDHGVVMNVEFATVGRDVVDYSVVLLLALSDRVEVIRLYDGSHRINEMHRYTRADGKQAGIEFHRGTLGEGMRAAIEEIESHWAAMIEGWER